MMKLSLFIGMMFGSLAVNAQHRMPETELFSPRTNLSLNLYQDSSFELAALTFAHDVTRNKSLYKGNYRLLGDTLFLFAGQGKVFRLRKQNFEMYSPINLDTLQSSELFLAWTIHYSNGKVKQTGGWSKENTKEGVWQYFDSTGRSVNNKVFKEGVLIDDNFKLYPGTSHLQINN